MIHTGDSPPDELPVSAVNHAVSAVHQEVVHSHTSIGGLKNLNQTAHNNDHTNLDSLLQHGQIPNTPSQRFESQQISRNDNQKIYRDTVPSWPPTEPVKIEDIVPTLATGTER